MKKIFVLVAATILLIVLVLTTGCNRQIIDTTWNYNRAILYLPNGEVIDGKIESWMDYKDGDQLQIKIDGGTYLIHSMNVVLIDE